MSDIVRGVVDKMTVKTCVECELNKDISCFYKRNRKSPYGSVYVDYDIKCKTCRIIKNTQHAKTSEAKERIKKYSLSRCKTGRQEERRKIRAKKGKEYQTLEDRCPENKVWKIKLKVDKEKQALLRIGKNIKHSMPWYKKGTHDLEKLDVKYRSHIGYNLSRRLWSSVNRYSGKYSGRLSTESIINDLGYNHKDLRKHIQSLFTNGMNRKVFLNGEIHIDHIKPIVLFDLKDYKGILKCWALSNLQPLWAVDNLKIHISYP